MNAPRYRALDHRFAFGPSGSTTTDAVLTRAFSCLADRSSLKPEVTYRLHRSTDGWQLDGSQKQARLPSDEVALRHLMWSINRRALDPTTTIVLHSGAVTAGDDACVLVGASNAGKSTLAAGLVARGFGYLTDELVTLGPDGRVRPYPKPIVLGAGSHELLPQLEPGPLTEASPTPRVWLVSPDAIRPEPLGAPAPIRRVFFVNAQLAQSTELTPISGAEGAVTLMSHIIRADRHGAAALDWAANEATRSRCFRLSMTDLDRACELVSSTLE